MTTNLKNLGCIICVVLMTAFIASCGDDKTATTSSNQATGQQEDMAANIDQDPLRGTTIKGKVLEALPAGGYTYIHLDQGTEKTWVALPSADVKVGDEVSVIYSMVMHDFPSKSLDRTFDKLIFASGFADGQPTAAPNASPSWGASSPHGGGAMGGMGGGSFNDALSAEGGSMNQPTSDASGTGSSKSVVPFTELKIDKATGENAHKVGDLFKKSAALNAKKVTVKGKVVKVTPNVMSRNWIHLQDGSGDPAKNTHDLVVTSSSAPNLGDVITIEGILAADKDFGAGYKYKVLVEEAAIK
ncbi:MAG: DNA-binding protein [Proteobacteria bacterium]|nr:DNA-binding protein [Pseudomonadota bacterium]MBU1708936.1 DNA-binding protein [Pseudomonadota bacterium]